MLRVLGKRGRPSVENVGLDGSLFHLEKGGQEDEEMDRESKKKLETEYHGLLHLVSWGGGILTFSRDQGEGWRDRSLGEGLNNLSSIPGTQTVEGEN